MITADVGLSPLSLLIMQASPFCNIDCSYCYLGSRADKARMQLSTVTAAARFLRDVPLARSPLTVVWHAGEPLAVPMSFYQDAFREFASEGGVLVRHNIQTNGTLINDAWCELFRRWDVRVGVSVDGPREIHDAHRVDRAGRGTFDRVMRGIAKLREHDVPFSVLAVVTSDSLDEPDSWWDFFESLGTPRIGLNVEEIEGRNQTSSLSPDLECRFREFIARIATRARSSQRLRLRELEDMRRHLSAPPGSEVFRSNNRPGATLNVDVHGNVTTFSPELLGQEHLNYGRFAWANVHTHSWRDIPRNESFARVHADVARGVEACRSTCGYFPVCGGGNPSNKLAECGTLAATETTHCRLHVKAIADVMLEVLEEEAQMARGAC